MDSTKRTFKFQNRDLKKSIGIFWTVILIVNLLSGILFISYNNNIIYGTSIKGSGSTSFIGANMMSIFIFIIIYGILMYYEKFALALSFGVTRKDFYKSMIVNNILVALIFGIMQGGLHFIEKYVLEAFGYKTMVEFGIFNTSTDNILFIVLSLSALFLTFLSVTNLLGVFQYRFGYKFWIGFGVVVVVGINVVGWSFFPNAMKTFSNIYLWLYSIFKVGALFIMELILSVICYTLGYFLIKKASIGK